MLFYCSRFQEKVDNNFCGVEGDANCAQYDVELQLEITILPLDSVAQLTYSNSGMVGTLSECIRTSEIPHHLS